MITITAATGRLGRIVIAELLERGVPADEIVAAVRNPENAADLAERGVQVRHADYDQPETLEAAFADAGKLLLIPSALYGLRFPQMTNAVRAAVAARVPLVAYAGFVNSATSTLRLADEHKQVEASIRESGLPYVFLRNGAYTELYCGELGDLAPALEFGVLLGSGGNGKISGATRPDLAAAAAAVLTGDGPVNTAYELGGEAFTLTELAAEISAQSGKPLVYQDLPVEEYARALAGRGVPKPFADLLADTSFAISRGDWYTDSTDLQQLIGRPPTPLANVVTAALKAL
ncbi:NmrA family NAD(P)-binding protein [Nonomuraea sp. NPDC005650]|uniref:NmrA family NAD(P)-binding protein n=1 Tax=Nonomuraea sp. NPDC005650 TaxID=3157045 RepID=UPI0033B227F1